jgi:nicotinate-nucleotide adenylyltransferase
VAVATDVADALDLDRVLWIPAGDPPHKRDATHSSPEVRLSMVRAAAEADSRFEASTLELERSGPSYTVDTVRELRRSFPDADLFLILGADQLRSFGAWRDPAEIARYVRLAVMDRGGESAVDIASEVPGVAEALFVPVRRVDVSSTDVRARRRRGESVKQLVPEGVWAIMQRERLYSAP